MTKRTISLAPARNLLKKAKTRATQYAAKRPHKSFRKTAQPSKKIGGSRLPSFWATLRATWQFIRQEKKLFIKLGLLYAVVSYILVGGISQFDLLNLKEASQATLAGQAGAFGTATTLLLATASGALSSSTTELQQFLGFLLTLLFWLAIVWAARMRLAGHIITARDALYNCAAPLVSSFVVLFVVALQLLPAALGLGLLSTAQSIGFLHSGGELFIFSAAAFLLCLLSLYWVTSSLLAMVVVTLPQMYPWRALANASELIVGQRWALVLRVVAMLLIISAAWVFVLFPVFLLDAWLRFDWLPLIPVTMQLLSAFSLIFGSLFVYKLYRSLL